MHFKLLPKIVNIVLSVHVELVKTRERNSAIGTEALETTVELSTVLWAESRRVTGNSFQHLEFDGSL